MTRTITVHRADPTGDQVIPVTTIRIELPIPKLPDVPRETPLAEYLRPLDEIYAADAEAISIALHDSLPGGAFDRLVMKLLEIKASHFRVSWDGR